MPRPPVNVHPSHARPGARSSSIRAASSATGTPGRRCRDAASAQSVTDPAPDLRAAVRTRSRLLLPHLLERSLSTRGPVLSGALPPFLPHGSPSKCHLLRASPQPPSSASPPPPFLSRRVWSVLHFSPRRRVLSCAIAAPTTQKAEAPGFFCQGSDADRLGTQPLPPKCATWPGAKVRLSAGFPAGLSAGFPAGVPEVAGWEPGLHPAPATKALSEWRRPTQLQWEGRFFLLDDRSFPSAQPPNACSFHAFQIRERRAVRKTSSHRDASALPVTWLDPIPPALYHNKPKFRQKST